MASLLTPDHPLLLATIDTLQAHAPFSGMAPADMEWLAERLSVVYFQRDAVLLEPTGEPPAHLYIVKQGRVEAEALERGERLLQLTAGEMFPLGALLTERQVVNRYVAGADSFCFRLARADFHALLQRSSVFADFCTRRLASLLQQSQRAVQSEYALALDEENRFSRPARSLVRGEPIVVAPATPLAHALSLMQQTRVGSVVVLDEGRRPVGILTLKDVLERVTLAQTPLDVPVASVMTPEPCVLDADAPVADALLLMVRHGLHHLPLVQAGQIMGVISEKDVFALRRLSTAGIAGAIARTDDPGALPALAHDIGEFARHLLAQGMNAENLTAILSGLNDRLTQRVIELEMRDADLPPVAWCWLALGSEGRGEQTLATDQDNALIFDGATDAQRDALLAFAARVNARLAACGFPLCQGDIMAGNPKWCLSLDDWRATFARWIHEGDAPALLHATVFFDFRPVFGVTALAEALRQWLDGHVQHNRLFLKHMVENALANRPPLGVVHDFVTSDDPADPTLDLKINGITPFVDAARIFALQAGIVATGTAARLRGAGQNWKLAEADVEAWVAAFQFIQLLRLRRQHAGLRAGQAPTNRLDPEQLNALDRRILKEAFRQGRKLQAVLLRYFEF